MADVNRKWKRVLLKLSGEALADKENGEILNAEKVARIADVIARMVKEGTQVGVVIGAGNIWRGALGKDVRRARADQMGMLGTMINCLCLSDAILVERFVDPPLQDVILIQVFLTVSDNIDLAHDL